MKSLSAAGLFLLAFCSFATAQSSFVLSEDSLTAFLPVPETTVAASNTLTNLTNDTLAIRWRRDEIALTAGALTQVCDVNQCYQPSVSSKTFLLAPDSVALMRVDLVSENGTPANVIVRLKFTNMAQPSDTASAYYFLSIGTSGSEEQAASLRILLYPNPVFESFVLDHAEAVHTVRMYDLSGHQVAEFAAVPDRRYSLASQPAGIYFAALADKNGKVLRALQVVKE